MYIYIYMCVYVCISIFLNLPHMRMWKQTAKNENTGEARLRRALISGRRNLLHLARNFSSLSMRYIDTINT